MLSVTGFEPLTVNRMVFQVPVVRLAPTLVSVVRLPL
jgi:hypothetical protein